MGSFLIFLQRFFSESKFGIDSARKGCLFLKYAILKLCQILNVTENIGNKRTKIEPKANQKRTKHKRF